MSVPFSPLLHAPNKRKAKTKGIIIFNFILSILHFTILHRQSIPYYISFNKENDVNIMTFQVIISSNVNMSCRFHYKHIFIRLKHAISEVYYDYIRKMKKSNLFRHMVGS